MPDPIKSLQCLPIAANFVFKDNSNSDMTRVDFGNFAKTVGRHIAKEFPGYSAADIDKVDTADSREEALIMLADVAAKKCSDDIKDVLLIRKLEEYLKNSTDAQKIDGKSKGKQKKMVSKVTSAEIHKYNHRAVHATKSLEQQHRCILRHNRIQELMDNGMLSTDNSLSHHLRHFASDRKQKLASIKFLASMESTGGNLSSLGETTDMKFFEEYFEE